VVFAAIVLINLPLGAASQMDRVECVQNYAAQTPPKAASPALGVDGHLWETGDIVTVVDDREATNAADTHPAI